MQLKYYYCYYYILYFKDVKLTIIMVANKIKYTFTPIKFY